MFLPMHLHFMHPLAFVSGIQYAIPRTLAQPGGCVKKPAKIVIVGGGIASFVAGIELRDRLPSAEIEILTAESDELIGGQLASWSENGFPIEHGLHALFGFYTGVSRQKRKSESEVLA